MGFFSKIFKDKDKKLGFNILLIFSLGVLMLLTSKTLFETTESGGVEILNPQEPSKAEETKSYEGSLEKRLEEALSQVAGVGKVKVMITLAVGREIVFAEDYIVDESSTVETDEAGGSRKIDNKKLQDSTVILQKNGNNEPLIVKEIEPKIEGVVIVAEGGDNIAIKDTLIRACESLLGIPTHKIQVLKMK